MTVEELFTKVAEPIEEKKEKKDYLSIALSKKVSQTDRLPRPETVLSLEHVEPQYRLFHKGSLSTVSGKAKVGKTTVIALLIASVIKSGTRVLWVDTEQGAYYANTTQFYLLQVAGLNYCENLEMYDFREFGANDRIELTEALLNEYGYDLVVIDGVRDLIFDINNPTEAGMITTRLMRWSVDYQCHVSILIHENKQGGDLRGHLGTECKNKSEIVLSVSKANEKEHNSPIVVNCAAVRGRTPFEDFYVNRDENGLPYIDTFLTQAYSKAGLPIEKPKKVSLLEFQEYPLPFYCRLVALSFENQNEEFNSTSYKARLKYVWSQAWKEHYNNIDSAGTREKINPTLALEVLSHLLEIKLIIKKPGAKPNSLIIEMNETAVENGW